MYILHKLVSFSWVTQDEFCVNKNMQLMEYSQGERRAKACQRVGGRPDKLFFQSHQMSLQMDLWAGLPATGHRPPSRNSWEESVSAALFQRKYCAAVLNGTWGCFLHLESQYPLTLYGVYKSAWFDKENVYLHTIFPTSAKVLLLPKQLFGLTSSG